MGKYFGKQPRYSRQEAEAQAKQAIDAAVSKGRPPDEEWKGLAGRMGDLNRELASRPRIDIPSPPPRRGGPGQGDGGAPLPRRDITQILRPRTVAAPGPELGPEPEPEAPAPVAAAPAPGPAPARTPAKRMAKAAAKATKPAARAQAKAPAKAAKSPSKAAKAPLAKGAAAKKRPG